MKHIGKRAICLVLALELYCAPMAMAQARGKDWDERVETPADMPVTTLVGDAATQETPAQPTSPRPAAPQGAGDDQQVDPLWESWGYFNYVYISYGLPMVGGTPAKFNGYLNYEIEGDLGRWQDREKLVCDDGMDSYTILPRVGRVPDMQFAGFYIYENEALLDESRFPDSVSWHRDMSNWQYENITAATPLRITGGNVSEEDMNNVAMGSGWLGDEDLLVDSTTHMITNQADMVKLDTSYGLIDSSTWEVLPIVARWLPSDRAEITQMSIFTQRARTGTETEGEKTNIETLYTANFAHKNLDEMAEKAFSVENFAQEGYETESQELWVRVDGTQESLTLDFEAFEPYYDYLKQFLPHEAEEATAPCPLQVTATYGAAKTPVTVGDIHGEIVNGGEYTAFWEPQNSADAPARSHWTVSVPLTAANGDADPFTTITFTLAAPDGQAENAKTYILHVERLTDSTQRLGYGNSPLGTIERDNSANWGRKLTNTAGEEYVNYGDMTLTTDIIRANKDFAKRYFSKNRAYHAAYYPLDSTVLQSGTVYKGIYANCWGDREDDPDYDLDETAVFAYLDSAFVDPGVTFTDSEGNPVRFGTGADAAYRDCVTRTIKLRRSGALTVDLYDANGGEDCWYDGANGLVDTETAVPMKKADGSDQVDLRRLKVVPGFYEMIYTFTDPVTGEQTVATRNLIILPSPGDVDMDGAVTAADAATLEENLDRWNRSSDPVVKLARGRTLDVTYDGRVETADVTAIFQGFQPQKTARSYGGDYYYISMPQGDNGAYQRKTWSQVESSTDTPEGKLTLEFLGLETGQRYPSGATSNIVGPWEADKEQGVELPTTNAITGAITGDTFWMGVKLTPDSSLAGDAVKDFTVTLIYDDRYLAPATVFTNEQLAAMQEAGMTAQVDVWKYVLRYYNLRAGGYDTDGRQKSIWAVSSGNNLYNFTPASDPARSYDTTHYSKVISDMERATAERSHLKELVFSIQVVGSYGGVSLHEGYVLAVPFRLIQHPLGVEEGGTTQMVELSAGMRDLNIVSTKPQSFFASLFSAPTQVTSAFSGQESIYGGATQNLRDKLAYDNESVGGVKIGKDRSETVELFNELIERDPGEEPVRAQYDVPFSCLAIANGDEILGLPPGLKYDSITGQISGSPTSVGTYSFAIRGNRYKIEVTPRVIRYYVDVQTSFYGEDEFRGETQPSGNYPDSERVYRTFTYKYYDKDIAPNDKAQAATMGYTWGEYTAAQAGQGRSGAELADYIEGFTGPTFVAAAGLDSLGHPENIAAPDSDVGIYPVYPVVTPRAKNYVFQYVNQTPAAQPAGRLNIVRRPIYLDYMTVTAERTGATVYHDQGTVGLIGLQAGTQWGDTIVFTLNGVEEEQGRPLTGAATRSGETFVVEFSGQFTQNDEDKATGTNGFVLHDEKEERQLKVSLVRLINEEATRNYELRNGNTDPITPEKMDVRGYVLRRGVERIALSGYPVELLPNASLRRTMYYGEGVGQPSDLMVYIVRGAGSSADTVGSYQYNSPDALALGLHYNWVTPEEYEAGKDDHTLLGTGRYTEGENEGRDMRPYGQARDGIAVPGQRYTFTPAQTGWRLCISVGKYTAGTNDVEYMKLYTEPITVLPRELILTPQSSERYYGDENGDLRYTYEVSNLLPQDRDAIAEEFTRARGNMEELEWLLARERSFYEEFDAAFGLTVERAITDPTIRPQKSLNDDTLVDANTDAAGTSYPIILSGGQSVNYTFTYRYTNTEGALTTSKTRGWSNLTIHRRPIVVASVSKAPEKPEFATVYADTVNLTVTSNPALSLTAGEVTFQLPSVRNSQNCPQYFVNYDVPGNPTLAQKVQSTIPYGQDNDQAVLEKDIADLQVEYGVTFVPDKLSYNDYTNSYYPVQNFEGGDSAHGVQPDGSRLVAVQVDKLSLSGSAARNYQLVYETDYNAQFRVPAVTTRVDGPNPNALPGNQESYAYQSAGVGRVWLRPIESLRLTSLGQMSYTYGDTFSPDFLGTTGERLTLTVSYATKFDNDLEHNVHEGKVEFQNSSTGNTFTDRGFTIGFARDGQTAQQADAEGQYLDYLEYLYPGVHNGVHLWIKGRRSPGDPVIYSQVTMGALSVRKKALTLTASDIHRFYGEPNETAAAPFTYTVLAQDLARPELDALGLTQPGRTDRVEASDLARVVGKAGYKAPTFATSATAASPVGEGAWGTYELTMTKNGDWDNYTITTQNAHIYVYPRPIRVASIESGETKPVYTIFHNTEEQIFQTQLGTAPDAGHAEVKVALPMTATYIVDHLSDGRRDVALPLSGTALLGNDQLNFDVSVDYKNFRAEGNFEDALNVDTETRVTGIAGGNHNYLLINDGYMRYQTIGAAKLRTIAQIHVLALPKLTYTYGETLDLSGLRVQIQYARLTQTEATESVTVSYQGKEQFKGYGLYVNYYDSTALPDQSIWKEVPSRFRVATSGDHVTIAPTHDTQGTATPFAANGKYLILSAFQAGLKQDPARPIILGENRNEYFEGTPIPVVVRPRQLTYTLAADDKTYDGTGATSGTLTLTNVFQQSGMVDDYNGQGVTDVVYVPVGASYENASADHHNNVFSAFKSLVQNGRVSFTTGSYVPNGEAPLLENGYTSWSANRTQGSYTYGTGLLDFTFVNPNVHYEDDRFGNGLPGLGSPELAQYWAKTQDENDISTRWDEYPAISQLPVAVTNMNLAGPDAANYTWGLSTANQVSSTSVTVATRAGSVSGQAAAPYATIHKANRAPIQTLAGSGLTTPSLGVDNHTNVVRLAYSQNLTALGDNNNRDKTTASGAATRDDFRDELHFEYALYYQDPETGLYTQWAGRTGAKGYQDTIFFGGEPVTLQNPEGYLPAVNQLPKVETANENTIYKGQRYLWAAEDTGLSQRGWRENSGFLIDPSAYPGGASFRDAYWFYDLYTTDRDALPRDTVFYPLVRLAATHNYNASGSLTGDAAVTAQMLDEAQKAVAAYLGDPESEEKLAAAQAASQTLFTASGDMKSAAQAASEARKAEDLALGEEGRWPDDPPTYENAAPAVKTYIQRLDLVSSAKARSDNQLTSDVTEYLIKTLEAVWFTDTLVYPEKKYLDAALYNHPTRYYNYYYDIDHSAQLNFSEQIFTVEDVISDIPVRATQPDGTQVETTITVNQDHTLTLYVEVNSNDGRLVRTIELGPSVLTVTLGSEPILLEVITTPELPSNRRYRWETSDPSVATVDENGLVTFRGLGTAIITIYTSNGKHASCVVTVTAPLAVKDTGRLFNTLFTGSYMSLDKEGNFYPKMTMTRGELVVLLDLFCRPNELLENMREIAYTDVTYRERYAQALRRMTAVGVVVGVPGTAFQGERLATRAEFATMMARFLELAIPDTRGQKHAFKDSGEDATWAYAYIDALARAGAVEGVGQGNFSPNRPITREEVAAVLARLLTIPLDRNGEALLVPGDVTPENWSFDAILRAVNAVDFPQPELPETEEA